MSFFIQSGFFHKSPDHLFLCLACLVLSRSAFLSASYLWVSHCCRQWQVRALSPSSMTSLDWSLLFFPWPAHHHFSLQCLQNDWTCWRIPTEQQCALQACGSTNAISLSLRPLKKIVVQPIWLEGHYSKGIFYGWVTWAASVCTRRQNSLAFQVFVVYCLHQDARPWLAVA